MFFTVTQTEQSLQWNLSLAQLSFNLVIFFLIKRGVGFRTLMENSMKFFYEPFPRAYIAWTNVTIAVVRNKGTRFLMVGEYIYCKFWWGWVFFLFLLWQEKKTSSPRCRPKTGVWQKWPNRIATEFFILSEATVRTKANYLLLTFPTRVN